MQSLGQVFVRQEDGSTLAIDTPDDNLFAVEHLLRLISVSHLASYATVPGFVFVQLCRV
jgi:hypothetical protein